MRNRECVKGTLLEGAISINHINQRDGSSGSTGPRVCDSIDAEGSRGTYYTFCDQLGTVMGLYGKETEKTKMEKYESYGFNNGNSDIMRFSFWH
jgi:hypothetical protein